LLGSGALEALAAASFSFKRFAASVNFYIELQLKAS
jgi:hypothetical protein